MDQDELKSYLLKNNILNSIKSMEPVEGGIINELWKITGNKTVIVKKFQNHFKSNSSVSLPPGRYRVAKETFHRLADLLEDQVTPELLFADDQQEILVLAYLPANDRLDRCYHERASSHFNMLGKTLAQIANKTYGHNELAEIFNNTAFQEMKYQYKYYDNISDERLFPVRDALMEHTRNTRHALVLGDVRLTNVFVGDEGVRLIDFEGAYYGDPVLDIAYLLAEVFLRYLDTPEERMKMNVEQLWAGYHMHLHEMNCSERVLIQHMGFHLLDLLTGVIRKDAAFVKDKENIQKVALQLILDDSLQSIQTLFSLI